MPFWYVEPNAEMADRAIDCPLSKGPESKMLKAINKRSAQCMTVDF